MTIGQLSEIIRQYAPREYNSIIIDTAVAIKKYDYCYIEAYVQRVDYKSERRSAAVDKNLESQLRTIISNGNGPYAKLDPDFFEDFKNAPKISTDSFFSNTKKKMDELMNGGRDVDHHQINLATENSYLSRNQALYAVKSECSIGNCPNCNGSGLVSSTDKNGNETQQLCPECKGNGHIATITFFSPKVSDKRISLTICMEGEIDGFPSSAIKSHIEKKPVAKRMLTHINGIDNENFDEAIKPYIDIIRDKTWENNAIEEIYYCIIPCYTFAYRNVLTAELNKGIVVNPASNPEIVLLSDGNSKILNRMKDSAKIVSRFFSNIGKSSSARNKEDLKRTIRLLIATVVADGIVSEEEKQSLTLAIRNIDDLTSKERDELATLLLSADTSFLNDDDFRFHDNTIANETLARMQEIANSDGLVHETERDLVERLKLQQNG